MPKTVFIQNWEERERGWGSRPDGFTVHLDKNQRDEYVAWYNRTFNSLPEAPDEYTITSGDPIEIEVADDLFDRIHKAYQYKKNGVSVRAIRGVGRHFSASPMRPLKDSDVDWLLLLHLGKENA